MHLPFPGPATRVSIYARDRVLWGSLGQGSADSYATLSGLDAEGRLYPAAIPSLGALRKTTMHKEWVCDINAIHGLLASREDLSGFTSMEDYAESCCADLLEDKSEEAAQQLLQLAQRRWHPSTRLDAHLWSPEIYLMNDGQSREFAAAVHLAQELGIKMPIRLPLMVTQVNEAALRELTAGYEMFAIPADDEFTNRLVGSLRMDKVQALLSNAPAHRACAGAAPQSPVQVLYLPRASEATSAVAGSLRLHGFQNMGAYLLNLARLQHANRLTLQELFYNPDAPKTPTDAPRPSHHVLRG